MVMFSGTPCQIMGLEAFLQKDYDNLLTVDFVCHGVPSSAVWHKYLKKVVEKIISPSSLTINQGWHKYIKD
jgi:coenzyme F420-reducing hydrogenase beta subunit